MAEDAGAPDLIAGGRLQLGISRGSPEQVIDGWRYFGYVPQEGESDADIARRHTGVLLQVLRGKGFAQPNPRPMFPNPPGLLRIEPHSEGLRDRIWWGAATNATAEWAAKLGMNLQSSTFKFDESGKPFHIQQAEQIRAFRAAWKAAGHEREPRVSVSRSIFALVDDRDRAYFGSNKSENHFGYIEADRRAVFGRTYAAEPDILIEELKKDETITEADTLLLTVSNQLGVDYNAHVIEAILTHVAPALGWRCRLRPKPLPFRECFIAMTAGPSAADRSDRTRSPCAEDPDPSPTGPGCGPPSRRPEQNSAQEDRQCLVVAAGHRWTRMQGALRR